MKAVAFTHEVFEPDEEFSMSMPFALEAPAGVHISMVWNEAEGLWIEADSAGFEHMAKVFAELAVRTFDDGWHGHFTKNWGPSAGPPEVTLARAPKIEGEII